MKAADLAFSLRREQRRADEQRPPTAPHTSRSPNFEALAQHQGAEMERQRLVNAALIRERDQAFSAVEAAHDLAAQYAGRLGIDIDRDGVLAYTTAFWAVVGQVDQDRNRLDGQRHETLRIADQLRGLVDGTHTTGLDVPGLAKLIADTLYRVNNAQGSPRKAGTLLARPDVPGVSAR